MYTYFVFYPTETRDRAIVSNAAWGPLKKNMALEFI